MPLTPEQIAELDSAFGYEAPAAAPPPQHTLAPVNYQKPLSKNPVANYPKGQMKSYETDLNIQEAEGKERVKTVAEREAEFLGNITGARSLLQKTPDVRSKINEIGSGFGKWDNSELGTAVNRFFNSDAASRKEELLGDLGDLELDLVKAKMKGQGTITEAERAIARQTLPSLDNVDSETANNILSAREKEAQRIMEMGDNYYRYRDQGMSFEEFERDLNQGKFEPNEQQEVINYEEYFK